ncbi:MAG: hypothetical protein E6933_13745 [Clostridiales bacterium]|nr:hypothetical protein [Clostridiales bacterium]
MVFLDAIHYHICSEGQIMKKPVYISQIRVSCR